MQNNKNNFDYEYALVSRIFCLNLGRFPTPLWTVNDVTGKDPLEGLKGVL